ncbi:hypothetical protein ACGF12_22760 [Kitasatospora sp. NPDC048296]|uniref:hypothetical protein n=1 Tax=Kitasatospora sp. NPDC048296 TaxID=3364048 RepID=UPI003713ABFC
MASDDLAFFSIVQGEAQLDSDRALVAFLRERIAERDGQATDEERHLLSAVLRVLKVFDADFEAVSSAGRDDRAAGRSEALGWTLRAVAFAAFWSHPAWQPQWRP